jgi:hypothetical protein
VGLAAKVIDHECRVEEQSHGLLLLLPGLRCLGTACADPFDDLLRR